MNGAAIDSILPILSVLVTAFRAIVQYRKLQTLIPTMPEERTSPTCTPGLVHVLLSFFCALPLQTFMLPPRISVFDSVPSLVDAATY
jgi:hypothetical protein